MEPIRRFTSAVVALPNENVDTDQIIPARFLKTTQKAGLGKALFADWRYDSQGGLRPDFPINHPDAAGAAILLAGNNFGCGSSREHAPWALIDFGFRAIVSTSFADIFRNNALKNGLLPIAVPGEIHAELFRMAAAPAGLTLTVDLEDSAVGLPDGRLIEFAVDPFSRRCLLDGVDELGYLLRMEDRIAGYESRQLSRA
jgi:3-isopropylmalate/(R)-2-methylmalate dehydratase small subunit